MGNYKEEWAMSQGGFYVDGQRFGVKADYEAALDDKLLIDQIRKNYNLEDADSIKALYKDLEDGKFTFKSPLGREFDDEIYGLYERVRAGEFVKTEPVETKGRRPKKNKSTKEKKPKQNNIDKDNKLRQKTKSVKNDETDLDSLSPQMRKQVIREIKAHERKRSLLLVILGLVCVLSLGYYGIYYFFVGRTQNTYDEWSRIREADSAKVEISENIEQTVINYTSAPEGTPDILEKYQKLYIKNKSLIGWIKIADTNIDYPVMQTSNNDYYLDHNLNQEYDKNGSIFMDMNCDVLKPSTNLIVYGHHMQSGKMFGKLGDYESEKFYETHKFIEFDTIYEEGLYQVMYVFRSHVFDADEITFKYYQFIDANSESEFNSYMNEMSNLSLYDTGVTAKYGDKLLTLSTCDYHENNGRFVVVAKRIQ